MAVSYCVLLAQKDVAGLAPSINSQIAFYCGAALFFLEISERQLPTLLPEFPSVVDPN